jgi:hypothetical protein
MQWEQLLRDGPSKIKVKRFISRNKTIQHSIQAAVEILEPKAPK